MELNEFVEKLYNLKKLLDSYNTEKVMAAFSKFELPKNRSKNEIDKFLDTLDIRQEHNEKAEKIKLQYKLVAQSMLDDLFEAGLKRVDDLYELTNLERLERS